MVFLKEDGSLDVERINSLPVEEYMEMMGYLTQEQVEEYISQLPINENHEPVKAVVVDYTLEEELERGCIELDTYLKNKKKELEKRIAEQENYKTKLL